MSDETKQALLKLSVKKYVLEFVGLLKDFVPNCREYLDEAENILKLKELNRLPMKFKRNNCIEVKTDPVNKITDATICI